MALQTGIQSYRTFVKGFISEATPLTFPENATIDESNFVLHRSGQRNRRLGMDFEDGYQLIDISDEIGELDFNGLNSFIWEAQGTSFSIKILVVSHGDSLSFFNANAPVISAARLNNAGITEIGFPDYPYIQATSLFGRLVIANGGKGCIVLSYDSENDAVSAEARPILVRDIWGVDDGYQISERRPTLTPSHEYNLVNQGWGLPNPDDVQTNKLLYQSYFGGLDGGAGGAWPSNADVPSAGKDPTNNEIFSTSFLHRQNFGSTPAPKGLFIIDAFRRGQSRGLLMDGKSLKHTDTVINVDDPYALAEFTVNTKAWEWEKRENTIFDFPLDRSNGGIVSTTSFAGRVWFAGSGMYTEDGDGNSPLLSSYIFFSQVVTSDDKITRCYQENDPTSEISPDPLDSDGGAIKIPDMGNVVKITTTGRSVMIFADNGIWEISGGETNFSATSFEVRKISETVLIAPDSVVNAEGTLVFWAEEGIYALSVEQISQSGAVQNITQDSIETWFQEITTEAKRRCRGIYDSSERKIRWLYGEKKNLACRFTSQLYPLYALETMTVEPELVRQNFHPKGLAELDIEPTVTGIQVEIVAAYTDYTMPPSELEVSADVLGIETEVVAGYVDYTMNPSELDITPTVTQILVEVVAGYVDYTVPPEEMDVTADVTGITLEVV